MKTKTFLTVSLCTAAMAAALMGEVRAQDYSKYSEKALQTELATNADSSLSVLVPMRDGIGLSTNCLLYTSDAADE